MTTLDMTATTQKTLFVSDLHLTQADLYANGMAWFDPTHHLERLVNFLEREVVARAGEVGRLVLLGDTFDTWQTPMDERPRTYAQIFEDNVEVIEGLRRAIERGVEVILTRGNHDWDLTQDELSGALPGARLVDQIRTPYAHAEHGHAQTLFNGTDLDDEGRPAGYFFGRLGEERLPAGHSVAGVAGYIKRGALNALHRPDFIGKVFEVIFEVAGVLDEEEFVLERGEVVTAGQVRERYARSVEELGVKERLWRLTQRPTNMRGSARRLHADELKELVVFGHSHTARLGRTRAGALYANCGAWCQRDAHAIELHESDGGARVALRGVHADGTMETLRVFPLAARSRT